MAIKERLFLESALLRDAGFPHGFSMRSGGVSPSPRDSLNFGAPNERQGPDSSALVLEQIAENTRRLAADIGFDPARLYQVHQVHGAHVVMVSGSPAEVANEAADAIVLAGAPNGDAGAAVGVRVADCVPILLASPETGAVAVVHAGWRGIVAGVIGAACGAMPVGGRTNWIAAIGPCIGPCCFEVESDVAHQIAEACAAPSVVKKATAEKAFVDLRRAVRAQLKLQGLRPEQIENVPGCTMCDAERFYSFRRDGEKSGRQLAVIARPKGAG